jgi:hypothetical protein
MPRQIVDVADLVLAAFVVIVALSGLAAVISDGARRFLLGRLLGSIYRYMTEETREADRQAETKAARNARIRQLVDDLVNAMTVRATDFELGVWASDPAHVAVAHRSVALLRPELPGAGQDLDEIAGALGKDHTFTLAEAQKMLRPIVQKAHEVTSE